MAFKLRSSGLPFKEMGSSPVHQGIKEDKFDVDEFINQQNTPKTPPKDNKIYGPITEEEHNKVLNKDKNKNTYNPVTPITREEETKVESKEDIKKPVNDKMPTVPVNDKINKEVGPVTKKGKGETRDWFNVKGYLKGEQGWIPDFEGESTSETASKISKPLSKAIKKGSSLIKDHSIFGDKRALIKSVGQKSKSMFKDFKDFYWGKDRDEK